MRMNWWTRSVEYIFVKMTTYNKLNMKLNKFVNNEWFYVKLNIVL